MLYISSLTWFARADTFAAIYFSLPPDFATRCFGGSYLLLVSNEVLMNLDSRLFHDILSYLRTMILVVCVVILAMPTIRILRYVPCVHQTSLIC